MKAPWIVLSSGAPRKFALISTGWPQQRNHCQLVITSLRTLHRFQWESRARTFIESSQLETCGVWRLLRCSVAFPPQNNELVAQGRMSDVLSTMRYMLRWWQKLSRCGGSRQNVSNSIYTSPQSSLASTRRRFNLLAGWLMIDFLFEGCWLHWCGSRFSQESFQPM